jgi:DNA modification methylase
MSDTELKIFGEGFFGSSLNPSKLGTMNKRFVIPPFTVLDTTNGVWRERKQAWIDLGLIGEIGRREDTTSDENGIAYRKTLNGFGSGLRKAYRMKELGIADYKDYDFDAEEATGVSVFDPVLCELVYRWFSKPNWFILDPFAGGSTRGVVASLTNRYYHGVEVRDIQVEANKEQAKTIITDPTKPFPNWILGDSSNLTTIMEKECGKEYFADLIFQCPPYYDLEVYSASDKDGSTHKTYGEFLKWYEEIQRQAVSKLHNNRFVAIVVGEIRDKKTGVYRNFVGDTISIFNNLGLSYWNEFTLINSRGSASLRTNRPFCQTRKATKVHQNLLVFYKGDVSKMRDHFEVSIGEIE